jgi:hypothetical protein
LPPVLVLGVVVVAAASVLSFALLFCQDFSFCVLYFISDFLFFRVFYVYVSSDFVLLSLFGALLCALDAVVGVNMAHGEMANGGT